MVFLTPAGVEPATGLPGASVLSHTQPEEPLLRQLFDVSSLSCIVIALACPTPGRPPPVPPPPAGRHHGTLPIPPMAVLVRPVPVGAVGARVPTEAYEVSQRPQKRRRHPAFIFIVHMYPSLARKSRICPHPHPPAWPGSQDPATGREDQGSCQSPSSSSSPITSLRTMELFTTASIILSVAAVSFSSNVPRISSTQAATPAIIIGIMQFLGCSLYT